MANKCVRHIQRTPQSQPHICHRTS